MSAIPPPGNAGLIQAQEAVRRAAEARAAEQNAEGQRTSGAGFSDKLREVIENGDRDSQVYADAEGTGSQGKSFEESAEDADSGAPAQHEDQGEGGLDVTA